MGTTIAYRNHIVKPSQGVSIVSLSPLNSDPSYPVDNLKIWHPWVKWRSTNVVSGCYITVQFDQAVAVNCVFVMGHNLQSGGSVPARTVNDENVGTGDGVTTTFNFQLKNRFIGYGSFVLMYTSGGAQKTVSDDGQGNLTGDGSGSINYTTGQVNLTTSSAPDNGTALLADYTYTPAMRLAYSDDGTNFTTASWLSIAGPLFYATFAEQSHTYWRLIIYDTENPDGYYEIGLWWLGYQESLSFNYIIDPPHAVRYVALSEARRLPFTYAPYGSARGVVEERVYVWRGLQESDANILMKAWVEAEMVRPIVMIEDMSNIDFVNHWRDGLFVFVEPPEGEIGRGDRRTVRFTMAKMEAFPS